MSITNTSTLGCHISLFYKINFWEIFLGYREDSFIDSLDCFHVLDCPFVELHSSIKVNQNQVDFKIKKENFLSKVLHIFYSLLSANTGSFFAACFDGIRPPIKVKMTLKTTSIIAPWTGSTALISVFPVSA